MTKDEARARILAERKIDEAEQALPDAQEAFLRLAGWSYSSRIGAIWLWFKELEGATVAVNASTAIAIESNSPESICSACDEPECHCTDGGEGPCVFVAKLVDGYVEEPDHPLAHVDIDGDHHDD